MARRAESETSEQAQRRVLPERRGVGGFRCGLRDGGAVVVEVIHISRDRAAVPVDLRLQVGGQRPAGIVFGEAAEHTFGQAAVHLGIEVGILRTVGALFLGRRFAPRFPCGCGAAAFEVQCGQPAEVDGAARFVHEFRHIVIPLGGGIGGPHRVEQVGVFGFVGGPAREVPFIGPFLFDRTQPPEPQHLALPLLPCVGDVGVFGGVADARGGIGFLRLGDDSQPAGAQVDLHGIGTLLHIGHRVGKDVLLGVARESVDHGEIPLADSAGRDLEVAAGTVGHVVG